MPTCLLVDGDFPTDDLQNAYGVQVLYRKQIADDWLRNVSTGYGWAKLCLLWESPFERFLYVDADTIFWGDLTEKLTLSDPWDIAFDEHSHYAPEESTVPRPWPPTAADSDEVLREYVGRWLFDTEQIEQVSPDFPWRQYADHYFTAGIYGARRGIFSLDEYKRLYAIKVSYPTLFQFGDQGVTNFLMIHAEHEGELRVHRVPWQTESGRITLAVKDKRFRLDDKGEPVPDQGAWIIHYTDYKPLLAHKVSGRPLNYFRRRAREEVYC